MANDNVVQYIIKLDSKNAEKGLDNTGKEAQQTAQQLDKMSVATDKLSQKTKTLAKDTSFATKQARNFRRAGRDLDGAFGDLAQGVGMFNPQLGHMLATMSTGASVVEGVGRSLVLFLNPAVAAAGAIALTAGGAFFYFEAQQEALKKRQEELAKALENTNQILEQQAKVIETAGKDVDSYYDSIGDAKTQLALLTGQTTQYAVETANATSQAQTLRDEAMAATSEQFEALNEVISARLKSTAALHKEIQLLGDAAEAEKLKAQLATENEALQNDLKRQEALKTQNSQIANQAREYEKVLKAIADAREADRRRAAARKRAAAAAREEARMEREFEKLYAEQEKKALEAKNAQLAVANKKLEAQQQIQLILQQAQHQSLNTREQIIARMNAEISNVRKLANTAGQRKTAEEAIKQIRENTKKQLEDLNTRENENARLLQEKVDKEKEITAEKEKQDKLDRRQQAADVFGAATSLDAAGIVGMVSPVAGSIMSSLMALGEKTPKQLREEARAQATALANGLAILPELLMSILPSLFVQLVEAIIDGVLNMLINGVKLLVQGVNDLFRFRDRDPDGDNGRASRRKQRRQAIRDFVDPTKSATYASGGRFLPRAAGGIRFTGSQDGLAMLHRGEFVVPQSGQRPQQVERQMQQSMSGGVAININAAVVERNAVDALVRQIENRFNTRFGVSSSNLFGGR